MRTHLTHETVDSHAYVLRRIDRLIDDLHLLRADLVRPRGVQPGDRRATAIMTLLAARDYVDDLTAVLESDTRG